MQLQGGQFQGQYPARIGDEPIRRYATPYLLIARPSSTFAYNKLCCCTSSHWGREGIVPCSQAGSDPTPGRQLLLSYGPTELLTDTQLGFGMGRSAYNCLSSQSASIRAASGTPSRTRRTTSSARPAGEEQPQMLYEQQTWVNRPGESRPRRGGSRIAGRRRCWRKRDREHCLHPLRRNWLRVEVALRARASHRHQHLACSRRLHTFGDHLEVK